jgi:sec-independent protein translocase protein TatA
LGKSMRIFKSELREMQSETKAEASPAIEQPAPVQSQRVDPPAASEQGHTEARPA